MLRFRVLDGAINVGRRALWFLAEVRVVVELPDGLYSIRKWAESGGMVWIESSEEPRKFRLWMGRAMDCGDCFVSEWETVLAWNESSGTG